jgi:nucleoside-diphosphate-sugar epimerase
MRALVTGAAGFLGRHFTAELIALGWEVAEDDVKWHRDSMDTFASRWPSETRPPFDLVVHAAAVSPHRRAIDEDPSSLIRNRALDAAMFDFAARVSVGRVLYISSCAVLDEEPDAYGRLKLAGEFMAEQVRACGVPVTVVRPYSGYGEDQSADFPFGAFLKRALAKADPFEIWNPSAVRDWIHVDDIVGASFALIDAKVDGPVSLCTGIGTSTGDLARMLYHKATGEHPHIQADPKAPWGVDRRVGDPYEMMKYYMPKVPLYEGIARALRES